MLKKIQIKIVISCLILIILTAVAIETCNVLYIKNLNENLNNDMSVVDIQNMIFEVSNNSKIAFIIILLVEILVAFIFGLIVLKIILAPISNLIRTAENATQGIKYLDSGKKKNEINNLALAFNSMNKELKENLTEATKQKNQTETILLYMTDGIIAFDIDGNITHINPAAKTFLNLNDNENSFEKIFKKFDIDVNLEKIIYLNLYAPTEEKIFIDDRTLNLFFAPYKNENDRPIGLIVVIQDITEHVKLDEMRKRFVADVSHELKTPITSIMGYADTLLENEVDEVTNRKFLERISAEGERMAKLVSDLLTLSKYDRSKATINKEEFDVAELVKYVFEGQEIEMKKKEQNGECYITSNVPLVFADKGGIERVIINILTNAIKYTPEGGDIKAYVGCVYNDAYIKIIDTGIGIPKEDLDKIFERFYRVDKARTRQMGGTGLGLSIAKEILDQNDCMINVKSEPGKGTEVVIRIPTKSSKNNQMEKDFEA